MKRRIGLIVMAMALIWACQKQFAEPTYAPNATAVRIWFKADQFYHPNAEIFLEDRQTWRVFTSFPLVYDNDPNKYGFGNPWVPGKGSNALYMTTLYSGLPGGLTSDSGYFNVTIPKCFEFLPETPTATRGKVNVIPQNVRLYRRDKSFFEIGITGGGTYDEEARLFEVEVIFDETAIGGLREVKRRYRFRP